jgi:hypothetical protein
MEGDGELRGEFAREGKVGVCFFATKAVMEVRSVKDEAEFPASICERAEERYRIGTAGETHGDTHSGFQERRVERESGERRAHERMIVRSLYSTHAEDASDNGCGFRVDHAAS